MAMARFVFVYTMTFIGGIAVALVVGWLVSFFSFVAAVIISSLLIAYWVWAGIRYPRSRPTYLLRDVIREAVRSQEAMDKKSM